MIEKETIEKYLILTLLKVIQINNKINCIASNYHILFISFFYKFEYEIDCIFFRIIIARRCCFESPMCLAHTLLLQLKSVNIYRFFKM